MAFKGTPNIISDAFSSAFRQKRAQEQREREMSQKYANEGRQNSLMEFWRQKNYDLNVKKNEFDVSNANRTASRLEAYNTAQIENIKTDNLLQMANAKRNAEYQKEMLGQSKIQTQSMLDKNKFDIENKNKFKGLQDYFKVRGKYTSTTESIVDPDDETKSIDIPLTAGKIKENQKNAENTVLSLIPKSAQVYYASNFMGKKTHPIKFAEEITKAREQGYLDYNDWEALMHVNVLRGDWGGFPDEVKPLQTAPKGSETGLLGQAGKAIDSKGNKWFNEIQKKYKEGDIVGALSDPFGVMGIISDIFKKDSEEDWSFDDWKKGQK